jgi:hypothetical protein
MSATEEWGNQEPSAGRQPRATGGQPVTDSKYRLRKILYLSGKDEIEVRADGPSLTVRAPQQAERRFPLARLEGMAVEGTPEIPFEVIRLCAAQGIPVAILSRSGAPFGVLIPWRGKASRRLAGVRWTERHCWMHWMRLAQEARREALEEAGLPRLPERVSESLERLLAHWSGGSAEAPRQIYNRLRAMLAAAVNRELCRLGVRGDERACGAWTAQRLITDVESWKLCRPAGQATAAGLEEAARIWNEIRDEFEERCRKWAAYWACEDVE